MSLLLIMNPGSGSGRGRRLWSQWEEMLRQAGAGYECVYTRYVGHAFSLAKSAKVDTVVAVGGDGTINEVLDGVMQSGNPDLSMGVLYSGTSPDFCRFHGISLDPARAVAALLDGEVQRVDVARITYHDAGGRIVEAHFGCSCNIGLGAAVARYANRWRRYLGDIPGTGLSLLRALLVNRLTELELVIDGETMHLSQVNNLSIVKNPYLASGLRLQLDVCRNDGALYLVGITGRSRTGMCRAIPAFYSGAVTAMPGVFVCKCRSVLVTSGQAQEIEFDGDPRGFLPVTVDIRPQALALIGGRSYV